MQDIDKCFNSLTCTGWKLEGNHRVCGFALESEPYFLFLQLNELESLAHVSYRINVLRSTCSIFRIHQKGYFSCMELQQRTRGEGQLYELRFLYKVSMEMHRCLIEEHNLLEWYISIYFLLK